jgi:GNAT superfamily N-acetyltransferase
MTERKRQKPKMLTAHVTYLEMRDRPSRAIHMPTRPFLALMHAERMPVAYYRYLYEQVGKPHHWYLRRVMDDARLAEIIHAPTTKIFVLYANGSPAGYFELDTARLPETVEIAYFGLCQGFTGMGIGKWFLSEAIQSAWDEKPQTVTVHTNTLDHPAALPLYQKLGFEPVGTGEEIVEAWG